MTSAQVGDTGLILLVPEVEPAVKRWREQHDSAAPLGVPAHVTVLYPWIPAGRLTDADHQSVAQIAGVTDPIELTFAAIGRFPGVLWLDPQPSGPILALVAALTARWPDYPPYGGRYGDEPVPHLTVADTNLDQLGTVVADIEQALPISATVGSLSLVVRQADGWALDRSFPFRR